MLLNTPVCDFGWKAPSFTLKDPQGQIHCLDDYLGENAVLVAFICNHCPYVKSIAKKFASDTATLKSRGVLTLAIMSNDYSEYPEDSPEKMIEFSQEFDFGFPYLIDQDQTVAKNYGAVCTPDFFGFNKDGELQYRGLFEESQQKGNPMQERTLLSAMTAISETGVGPTTQRPSMGCSIKWK